MSNKKLNSELYWNLLKKKKKSQAAMAEELKINEKTLSAYKLSGDLDEDKMVSIAKYLGTSVDNLWKESDSEDLRDYRTLYEMLLVEYNEMMKEYNKCLQSSSGMLSEGVVMNQRLIYYLYEQLKIAPPPKLHSKDKSVNENVKGNP